MLLNSMDYLAAAKRRLPRGLFDYIACGTEDGRALDRLRTRLETVHMLPRSLTGYPARDLSTTVLGHRLAMPVVVAPTALAGLVAHDGETKLARAAATAGVPFCISTMSITAMEQIRQGAPDADLWMQFYVWKDRSLAWTLLDRAKASGIDTLILTVDTMVGPKREHNQRNGFSVPFAWNARAMRDVLCHPRWLTQVFLRYLFTTGVPIYGHYPAELRTSIVATGTKPEAVAVDPTLNWDDLAEIRRRWQGKLIVKGVMHPEDAVRIADMGADGLVVSSHGARNLDILAAPIDALGPVVDKVGSRLDIFADSGVMRGTDVLRYLSQGAKAVFCGRVPLWGLAADDEAGAVAILAMLKAEIDLSMTFLGIRTPAEVTALAQRSES